VIKLHTPRHLRARASSTRAHSDHDAHEIAECARNHAHAPTARSAARASSARSMRPSEPQLASAVASLLRVWIERRARRRRSPRQNGNTLRSNRANEHLVSAHSRRRTNVASSHPKNSTPIKRRCLSAPRRSRSFRPSHTESRPPKRREQTPICPLFGRIDTPPAPERTLRQGRASYRERRFRKSQATSVLTRKSLSLPTMALPMPGAPVPQDPVASPNQQ
jgi:hypothetical protein